MTERVSARDHDRIAEAIHLLAKRFPEQPSLADAARAAGLSEFHFQRLFRRLAGVSPKRFLQHLTVDCAGRALREHRSVLEAAFEAGLSSSGRLHDLFVAVDAVTPGEHKAYGVGVTIAYGFHATPFGRCLIGETARGICHLAFIEPGAASSAMEELRERWPEATLREEAAATRATLDRIFTSRDGSRPTLHLKGTNFQLQVWQALLRIPEGETVTYGELARAIDRPGAARAVGGAVGANAVALLVPCHRVLRAAGVVGGYRWGPERKRALLAWEAARNASSIRGT